MPKSTYIEPGWTGFVHVAIEDLRRHHGGRTSYIEETKDKIESASDPDALFAGFDGDAPGTCRPGSQAIRHTEFPCANS